MGVLFCGGFGNSAPMLMPAPDPNTIADKPRLAAALAQLLPPESVIADPIALKAYESDGLTAYRQAPLLVTLPRTTAEVSAVLKFCAENKLKVVPRGAGTSLSGGALPLEGERVANGSAHELLYERDRVRLLSYVGSVA